MPNKDFYNVLGVSENATDSEIKRSYRELAKKYHPDKHKGDQRAEERFKEISEAYAALGDSKKRAQYDQMRRFGGAHSGDFQNFNFDDVFQGGFHGRRTAGGTGGLGDLFGDLFGGGAREFSQQPRKGQDISAELTVAFDMAVKGGKQTININGRRLSINIPVGVESGKKIRLRGQGNSGMAGGAAGDLIITFHVAPHPDFKRTGADIYNTVTVNMVQAALGSKVPVQTYEKGKVHLKIPAGTQNGKMLKLKGMGVNVNGHQGDHYVEVKLTVPKNLDEKSKKSLEQFGKAAGIPY